MLYTAFDINSLRNECNLLLYRGRREFQLVDEQKVWDNPVQFIL